MKKGIIYQVINYRKITIFILIIAILAGIYSYREIPKQENPIIEMPAAAITVVYPGASPQEVEKQVTEKIENAVMEINGYDFSVSTSAKSLSSVIFVLRHGADIDNAWSQLRREMEDLQGKLPKECLDIKIDSELMKTSGFILTLYGDNSMLKSDGKGRDSVTIEGGAAEYPISLDVLHKRNHYLLMKGKDVGENASRFIPEALEFVIRKSNLSTDQINYIVPHQPNLSLLRKCIEKLNISEDKIVITLDKYGNMGNANIPVALDKANREGKIKSGDYIAMVSVGAGWTWGSSVLKWGA